MQTFAYQTPTSVADAVRLAKGADAKLIAGGQSLLGSMKLGLIEPGSLVDLGKITELKGIRRDGAALVIGAMTTHAEVAASHDVQQAIHALVELAEGIGDRQVRNRGTLGGSLANSDPSADWPAAVLGLGATIQTDHRSIAADDFFKGLYETALQEGEVITAARFPVVGKAAYVKFAQPASRFALVGVFVSKSATGVRVAVTGAGACVFRVKALEDKLTARWAPQSCDGVVVSGKDLNSDLHGSADYRAALIPVLARRAVAAAS